MPNIFKNFAALITSKLIASVPESAKSAIYDKTADVLGELIKEELINTLEADGYDVQVTVRMQIKKN